jgi:glycosyltransferase involved in cell wall biosynthesis
VDRYYRYCLPLFPTVVELFDLDAYDLVVSSSHCAVKSAVATGRGRHLCYCHSPVRYAWDQFDAYFGRRRLGAASVVLRAAMRRLARWDAATSSRVDRYLANSQYVAGRIRRYYNRRAAVVHPPVDTDFFHPGADTRDGRGAVIVSALVPYKRLGIAVDACRDAGLPLTIIGQGPERARLERHAGGQVTFLGAVSDEVVRDHYRRAEVVLLPGEEDFGLVPLEAHACGTPVVALARGGALETVVDGVTGILVREPGAPAFSAALARLPALAVDRAALREHALQFSRDRFVEAFDRHLDDLLNAKRGAVRW